MERKSHLGRKLGRDAKCVENHSIQNPILVLCWLAGPGYCSCHLKTCPTFIYLFIILLIFKQNFPISKSSQALLQRG